MLGAVTVSVDALEDTVTQIANRYGLEPALLKGFIKTESNWNVNASRFEAKLNDTSWGLMQILLSTGRSVTGNSNLTIPELISPETNIDIGARYVLQQLARYKGNVQDAIAAYNAGSARKDANGVYINNAYVQSVYGNYVMYSTMDQIKQAGKQAIATITDAGSVVAEDPTYLIIGIAALLGVGMVVVNK